MGADGREDEILKLLQEIEANCVSINKGLDETIAIVKDTNAMLAARRQTIAAREGV